MAGFSYKALSENGSLETGTLDALDKKEAVLKLKKRGLNVVNIKFLGEARAAESSSQKIKGGEAVALQFFRKLHQLCKAGTPVGDALKGLSLRSLNKNMLALSKELYKSLSEGKSLASSLESFPDIFEGSIIHLVEAGESTANLVSVFENIIDYLENRRVLRKKVISALIYPAILFTVAFAVVLLFLFVLLPQVENMMKNLGGELNLPVKILIFLGDAMIYGGPVFIALIVISFFGIMQIRSKPKGLIATDRFFLKLPIFGNIAFDSDICRLSNLISTLFESGVNTTETMRLTEKSIKNADIRMRFSQCKTAINDGAAVATSFKKFGILNDDDIDIVSVGDKTGNLIEGFAQIRNMHMESLGARIKNAIAVLSASALLSAFTLVFLVALGIISAVLGLSQNLIK